MPATVGLEKHKGKYTSGSDYYSLGSQRCQHASKSKEQLDKTSSGPLQTKSGPRPSQESIDIAMLTSNLLAAKKKLEESLKETKTNANLISQLEKKLSQSKTSLEAMKSKFKKSKSKCKELQCQIEALGKDLKETQEQVFRLQPLRENVTQNDALRKYIAICHSVKSWIGLRLYNGLNTGSINLAKIHPDLARKLIDLLTQNGRKGTVYLDTDEHNIIAVVMEFLRVKIFETGLYGAVERQELKSIYQIQKNMKNLTPRQGKSTV